MSRMWVHFLSRCLSWPLCAYYIHSIKSGRENINLTFKGQRKILAKPAKRETKPVHTERGKQSTRIKRIHYYHYFDSIFLSRWNSEDDDVDKDSLFSFPVCECVTSHEIVNISLSLSLRAKHVRHRGSTSKAAAAAAKEQLPKPPPCMLAAAGMHAYSCSNACFMHA